MSPILVCVLTLMIGSVVYRLLPALACRLDHRLKEACLGVSPASRHSRSGHRQIILPEQWRDRFVRRLRKAGYFSPGAFSGFLLLQLAPVPVLVLLCRLCGIDGNWPALAGVILITAVNGQISRRIRLRQKAFSRALFKIYRFLDLQMTAGIKVTDSLRGLPEAVSDPVVNPILTRFAALYELTLDLDQSLTEIRLAFPGPDCDLLATHLRQCLQTGQAGHSLVRMEELLFARTFNLMQAETAQIRTQLLLTAILGITPGIILFLYPFLLQAFQAVQSVFG